MDWILLGICIVFFAYGFYKGFVSMLFSFIGMFFVVVLAWKLSDVAIPFLQNLVGEKIFLFVKNLLDDEIAGSFSNLGDLQTAVANSKLSLFGVFLFKLLGDLSFDGQMSAGQILAPSITEILFRVFSFVLLFIILYIVIKFFQLLLNKIIKKMGLGFSNRVLGGVLGLLKGLVLFAVIFFILSSLANLFLSETLLSFVNNGVVSKMLYDNFILKIVELFY